MRSRTEMVTTTFVDSEEDYSDDDDSEEDWRPSASSKNGKKQKQHKATKKRRKRKNSLEQGQKSAKRKFGYEESDDEEVDDPSEDDYNCDDLETDSLRNKSTNLPPKKQFSDKNSSNSTSDGAENIFNLLVYIKDLKGTNVYKNNSLCLWRKDKNNLLQKYIRVKTSPEQFLFTSSSVYSSFDDKRISDFHDIKVKSLDSSNRRVEIINPHELQKIALKNSKNENNSDDDISSDEKSDIDENKHKCANSGENLKKTSKPVPKRNNKHEEDEEEEIEEENYEEDDSDLEEDNDDHEENDECDD